MRNNGGNLLLTVLCVMFVLCTLAMALHWQQARARAVYLRQEAELQARQAADYQLAKSTPLTKPKLDLGASESSTPDPPTNVATQLYDLPDLEKSDKVSWDGSFQAVPGSRWTQLKPTTLRPDLSLARRRMLAVLSNTSPYAALAPKGEVKLESAVGWANPTFPDTLGKDPASQVSAIPAWIGAGKRIEVDRVGYGELFSLAGPFQVGQGSVVAHQGYLPTYHREGLDYPQRLEQQLTSAISTLSARAQNKTALVSTGPPGVGDVWGLLTGSKSFEEMLGGALSLRQALQLPMPMIPGGNENGIVTNIWLHVPFAPDGAISEHADELKEIGDKVDEINKKIEEAKKKLENLENELTDLKKQLAAAVLGSILAIDLAKKIKDTVEAIEETTTLLEDLKNAATEFGDKAKGIVDNALATSSPDNDGPATRDDEAGLGTTGQEGWAYAPVFSKILSIFGDVITGQFEKLGEDTMQRVRLVHFGPHDNKTGLRVGAADWDMTATLNVPPGRSLRYDGNMTIRGDLWIQKGGSLVVNGNLTMVNPQGSPSSDLLTPQGKICLEEGSSLVVSGNLTGAGAPRTGSMLVSSPVNVAHPVTIGVLASGDVNLPYGIFPALSLTDLTALVPALTNVGANLSKADGPFHKRKPYFAKYATTFQIVKIPPPFPAIIPLAIPLPTPKNVLNPVFSSLSTVFTAQLNLMLGENYMTYTDWWFFGKGVVPMVPKIDPASMVGLQGLTAPTLPDPDQILDFVKGYATSAVKEMVTELVTKVVTKLIVSQLGFGLPGVGDLLSGAVDELATWVTKSDDADALAGNPPKIDLSGMVSSIQNKLSGGEAAPMLAECGGLLLFSGKFLTVGSDPGQPSPLAVGYLVARQTVSCQTDVLVGAALSFEGDVRARKLLYLPEMTRASLYLVRNDPDVNSGLGWMDWALQPTYGADFDSHQGLEIGPPLPHLRTDSWDR